jgi:hypothetical protein
MRFTPLSVVSCIINDMVLHDLFVSLFSVDCDVIASSVIFRCVRMFVVFDASLWMSWNFLKHVLGTIQRYIHFNYNGFKSSFGLLVVISISRGKYADSPSAYCACTPLYCTQTPVVLHCALLHLYFNRTSPVLHSTCSSTVLRLLF